MDAFELPTLTGVLNVLAGTWVDHRPTLSAADAANRWAGTSGLTVVGALNVKAGIVPQSSWLGMGAVCNVLGGTTGLDEIRALLSAVGLGAGDSYPLDDLYADLYEDATP